MSFMIVIAHYDEDLEWTKKLPAENIVVYSKGALPDVPYTIIKLPNIGLEAHTYLTYIIDNYDSLPDVVFFMQGRDDCIKAEQIMDSIQIFQEYPNIMFASNRIDNRHITDMFLDSNYHIHQWKGQDLYMCKDNFVEWFKKYVDKHLPYKNIFLANLGACFAVSKEAILSRPKDYYVSLKSQFSERFEEIVHFIERSWVYVFNSEFNVFAV